MTTAGVLASFVMVWASPTADLTGAVPRETAAAVFLDFSADVGDPSRAPPGAMATAFFLLRQARRSGLTSSWGTDTRIVADIVGSLPTVAAHPMAILLLDARAKALERGGYRLAGLRGAVVLGTNGQDTDVTRRIQELLNLYTDKEHSTITKCQTDGVASFVLTDRRSPDWVVLEWGPVDGFFVMAVGDGVFRAVTGAIREPDRSLKCEPWFSAAQDRCRHPNAFLEVYADLELLREQLGQVMGPKPEQVATALGLSDVQRGLWSVGRRGRFVEGSCVLRSGGQDRHVPITMSSDRRRTVARAIPDGATTCTVLDVSAADLILRARDAYLASKSCSSRVRLARLWDRYVDDPTWSVEADFLDQLGHCVVVHNDPPHPLGLPLLCTILVRIDGSSEDVSASIERLLGALQRRFLPPSGATAQGMFAPALRRAPDGVWFLQVGLVGPALAVTDGWIVISYAPQAVRQNVQTLRDSP